MGARDAATEDLTRVRRDPDTTQALKLLEDRLESANRRALEAWLRSGRTI